MARRKQVSKRRWIARFMMGKTVPHIALLQYPTLARRLHRENKTFYPNIDCFRRAA